MTLSKSSYAEKRNCLFVDHRRGDFSEPAIGTNCPDNLIYSGEAGIIAASTTPYYGGGLRLVSIFDCARALQDLPNFLTP